jgi:hypothetical protein
MIEWQVLEAMVVGKSNLKMEVEEEEGVRYLKGWAEGWAPYPLGEEAGEEGEEVNQPLLKKKQSEVGVVMQIPWFC